MRGKIVERTPTKSIVAPVIRTQGGFPQVGDRFARHFGSRRKANEAFPAPTVDSDAIAAASNASGPQTKGGIDLQQVKREGKALFDAMAQDEKIDAANEARTMLRPDIIEMLRRRGSPQAHTSIEARTHAHVHPLGSGRSPTPLVGSSATMQFSGLPSKPRKEMFVSSKAQGSGGQKQKKHRVRFETSVTKQSHATRGDSSTTNAEFLGRMAQLTSESQLHELAAEMLPTSELEKLRWMSATESTRVSDSAGSEEERAAAAAFPFCTNDRVPPTPSPRVNLQGQVLCSPASCSHAFSKELHEGAALHHHGREPDRPGYTTEELLTLAGSAMPLQRSIALTAIVPVLQRQHITIAPSSAGGVSTKITASSSGEELSRMPTNPRNAASSTVRKGPKQVVEEIPKDASNLSSAASVVCAALSVSARGNHLTSLCAALCALHALFYSSSSPVARRAQRETMLTLAATHRGQEQLAPAQIQMDIVRVCIRCKVVGSLRYSLLALQCASAVESGRYISLAIDVLVAIASTCRSGAAAIVADARLVAFVLDEFVAVPVVVRTKEEADNFEALGGVRFGAGPCPSAFTLVRALCSASRSHVRMLDARDAFRSMFSVLAVVHRNVTEDNDRVLIDLQREALLTWRCCLSYELRLESTMSAHTFLWLFPALENWRTRHTPRINCALFLALDAVFHACSTLRTTMSVASSSAAVNASTNSLPPGAIICDRLRVLCVPVATYAAARIEAVDISATVSGAHVDHCCDIAAAAHLLASVHELHARGVVYVTIQSNTGRNAALRSSVLFCLTLLKSGVLRDALNLICVTVSTTSSGSTSNSQGLEEAIVSPRVLASAADLVLASLRLSRWLILQTQTRAVSSPLSKGDDNKDSLRVQANVAAHLGALRSVLAADLSRFVDDFSGASINAQRDAAAHTHAYCRTVARLLSYIQCEALAHVNMTARAQQQRSQQDTGGHKVGATDVKLPGRLSLADISAPYFGPGEEADAREWLSSVLTVERIAALAHVDVYGREELNETTTTTPAKRLSTHRAMRGTLIDFYADGVLSCPTLTLANASNARLQRGASAMCPTSLHLMLNEHSKKESLARREEEDLGASLLLPRGWLLLPLANRGEEDRATSADELKTDHESGSDQTSVLSPSGLNMRDEHSEKDGGCATARQCALYIMSCLEFERRARLDEIVANNRAARSSTHSSQHGICNLHLNSHAESQATSVKQRQAAVVAINHTGHAVETVLSLLHLSMCPSRIIFAPYALHRFDNVVRLLAQREPHAILRSSKRIGSKAFYNLTKGVSQAFIERSYGNPACARCVLMLLHAQLEPRCRVTVLTKLAESRVLEHFPQSVEACTLASLLSPPERDVCECKAWAALACSRTAGFDLHSAPLLCEIGIARLRQYIFGPFDDEMEEKQTQESEATHNLPLSGLRGDNEISQLPLSFSGRTVLTKLCRGTSSAVYQRLIDSQVGGPAERARMRCFAEAIGEVCVR